LITEARGGRLDEFPASLLNKVVELTAIPPHTLEVTFADGTFGKHIMVDTLKGSATIIEPLNHPGYFVRVFLKFGAPTWPNGYDMRPDWLRMEMEKAGELHRPAAE
jgi:hypothetical protein